MQSEAEPAPAPSRPRDERASLLPRPPQDRPLNPRAASFRLQYGTSESSEHQAAQRDAHRPSPPSGPRSPSLLSHDSAHSSASASSSSSAYSLPSLPRIEFAHLFLLALTLLLLCVLPFVLLWLYKRRVEWDPFGLGIGAWLAAEMGREVVFELFTSTSDLEVEDGGPADEAHSPPLPERTLALPTVVHSLLQELLRLFALHLVVRLLPPFPPSSPSLRPPPSYPPSLPPLDPLFFSALWFALGWSATEIVWSSRRLWRQLELYREVLGQDGGGEEECLRGVPRVQGEEDEERQEEWRFGRRCMDVVDGLPEHLVHRHSSSEYGADDEDDDGQHRHDDERDSAFDEEEVEMDDEVFRLRMREVQREELEAQLGVPLFEVPVGVIFIWRLDSILLSLVFTLLLSLPFRLTPPTLLSFSLWPTFLFVSCTHALLAWLWLAKVRRMGIPSISYASLVVLVGLLFGTLGAWGVLQ
ncbi:hypothetical protein NBRC10513_007804 [Rhodotorula toruloides]|uniref:Uncharacterized protein n=2 Tax=Rhodotorula toruloides TaxID=5286 RepID=A0A2T0AEE1_RHOTO|nr:hypothetical protein AAT19DRAFT_13386 [Rhodotorula toruloides]